MKRTLSIPLMNGGGCCKTVEDVKVLAALPFIGAIVVGSITKEPRLGNSGDTFQYLFESGSALNSLGMPNGGWQYLFDNLKEMALVAHEAKKALVVNVAGFNPDEYAMLTATSLLYADAVELNLGCPNVLKDDGTRKPIASFDLELMDGILSSVTREVGAQSPIWAKMSPYSDPQLLKDAAAIMLHYPVVKAVTTMNTFPNAYGVDYDNKPLITVGLAGLSGAAVKPIGLGQVVQWRDALQGRVKLVGVGGIRSLRDMEEYRLNGADAFQVTTELLKFGRLDPHAIEKMFMDELSETPA